MKTIQAGAIGVNTGPDLAGIGENLIMALCEPNAFGEIVVKRIGGNVPFVMRESDFWKLLNKL